MDAVSDAPLVRLTSLAHGGGCGCKLAPAVLQELLAGAAPQPFAQLIVGAETSDDAAVWQVDDATCIIATTDFFTPIVDDPFDFGRIAATNAISDVFAMGGKPVMALAILGMPLGKIAPEVVRRILDGGRAACGAAGIPVAGGHSIDSAEPIYGLAVIGTCRPDEVRRNGGARPGDALILTKGLGVGVYSAAFKQGKLSPAGYDEMVASTTLLNSIGADLAKNPAVHAMTDVTGFGILGHALEMARASDARVTLSLGALPFLSEAQALAEAGVATGASTRNWSSYGPSIDLTPEPPLWRRQLLTDPQTSGGLLVACAAQDAERIVALARSKGFPMAAIVGRVEEGEPRVRVES